jgi:hypothetical protein
VANVQFFPLMIGVNVTKSPSVAEFLSELGLFKGKKNALGANYMVPIAKLKNWE